jgi:hypothetical protein
MLARSILLIGTMASIATASWVGRWAAEVNLPANPYIVLENWAKLPNWRMWVRLSVWTWTPTAKVYGYRQLLHHALHWRGEHLQLCPLFSLDVMSYGGDRSNLLLQCAA